MNLVVRVYIPPYHTSFHPWNSGFIIVVVVLVVLLRLLWLSLAASQCLDFFSGPPMHCQALNFVGFVLSWTARGLALSYIYFPSMLVISIVGALSALCL